MNFPTKLTVLRIILSFVIVFLLLFPFASIGINVPRIGIFGIPVSLVYLISGVIFVVASITDFIDGQYARKHNMVTDLGKMLDAIADKVLVNSVLIILAVQGPVPTIVAVIVIIRDIIVDAIKMQAAAKGKVVAAIKSGKWKTATLMTGLTLAFICNAPFDVYHLQVSTVLLYIAGVLSLISAIQYFVLNRELIFPKNENS